MVIPKRQLRRKKSDTSEANIPTIIISDAYQLGPSASKEVIEFVQVFQPLAEKDDTGKELREKFFNFADQNRTGYVSLAETEIFIKHALTKAMQKDKAKEMFLRFRKSYIKAFTKAKSLHDTDESKKRGSLGGEYVTFAEFRLFNAYLCIYGVLWDAFSRINPESDRIDFSEFIGSYHDVRDYGFVALSSISSSDQAAVIYDEFDVDDSKQISYQEWCSYILDAEAEEGTELGKLMGDMSLSGK